MDDRAEADADAGRLEILDTHASPIGMAVDQPPPPDQDTTYTPTSAWTTNDRGWTKADREPALGATDLSESFYCEGKTLNISLRYQDQAEDISVEVKIVKCHRPFTLSCVMTVELPDALTGCAIPAGSAQAILKLYDSRFAVQMRRDYHVKPWSNERQVAYKKFACQGHAAEFVRRLNEDEDFGEPEEGWTDVQNDTYLRTWANDLYETESNVYEKLREFQSHQIPRLYATATLPFLEVPGDMRGEGPPVEKDLFEVKGLLIEYISGPTLSDIPSVFPSSSWQEIVDQAVQVVLAWDNHGILNKDVRPSNFVIEQRKEADGGENFRAVAIDFAMCEVRTPEQSDTAWGRLKWRTSEEGCIGAVMQTRLKELGFALSYEPSYRYLEYAPGEFDEW